MINAKKNVTLRSLNVGMKENISSSSKSIQLTARHLYRHFTQVKLALFVGGQTEFNK